MSKEQQQVQQHQSSSDTIAPVVGGIQPPLMGVLPSSDPALMTHVPGLPPLPLLPLPPSPYHPTPPPPLPPPPLSKKMTPSSTGCSVVDSISRRGQTSSSGLSTQERVALYFEHTDTTTGGIRRENVASKKSNTPVSQDTTAPCSSGAPGRVLAVAGKKRGSLHQDAPDSSSQRSVQVNQLGEAMQLQDDTIVSGYLTTDGPLLLIPSPPSLLLSLHQTGHRSMDATITAVRSKMSKVGGVHC